MATLLSWTSVGIGDPDVFVPSPPCLAGDPVGASGASHYGRRIAANGSPPASANVDVVEHMGSENIVHLTSGDSSFVARMESSANPAAELASPIV